MWGTSQGDRTLTGDEGDLVRKSVGYLRDMITAGIDSDDPYQSEVNSFNHLQPTQQLASLHEVAYGLLDAEVPIAELTAVREATVYTIYRELLALIEFEIELAGGSTTTSHSSRRMLDDFPEKEVHKLAVEECFQTRAAVVATCHSFNQQFDEWAQFDFHAHADGHHPPEVHSENLDRWSETIEFLANQVLWDRDFEMEEIFADHDPAKIAEIKTYLGIHEDYFSTPAPDAYSNEYQRIDRELVLLTRKLET